MGRRKFFLVVGPHRLVSIVAALLVQINVVVAHTVSIGYENAGPGAVTFWYGSYHAGVNFTEGSLLLVGPGTNSTVSFSNTVQIKPTGLIDGTTNFYSNGTALVGNFASSAYVGSGMPQGWQGVTFSSLTVGTYTFTYVPIGSPTATWQPIDAVILSRSVTLTAILLGGGPLAPSAVNGNQSNVANAIDNALAGGAVNAGFSALSSLTGAALDSALTQLAGESAAGSQQSALQIMNPFLTAVLDPFISSRANSGGFGQAMGYAAPAKRSARAEATYAAVTPKQPSEVARRWSVWSSSYGGHNRTSGDAGAGSHDSSIDAYGTAIGVDYRLSPDTVVGAAMAAGATKWACRKISAAARARCFSSAFTARHERARCIGRALSPMPGTACRPIEL